MLAMPEIGAILAWGPGIALFAALLQAATGFGFSLMATPLFLLVYEPETAIQLNIVLGAAISLVMLPYAIRDADAMLLRRLLVGALAGAPVGLVIYLYGNAGLLKGLVATVALALALLLAVKMRFTRTSARDYGIGAASGLLATSIGVPGPPLMLYFSGTVIAKESARATTLTFFLFVYTAVFAMQVAGDGLADGVGSAALICLPLTLVGVVIGQSVFRFISQQIFVILIWLLLVATGLYLLRTTL